MPEADIIVSFPNPALTKIRGKPSQEQLLLIKKKIKQNASSIKTLLEGGSNGHLCIVMTPAKYTTQLAILFVIPVASIPTPIFSPGTMQIQARLLQLQFKKCSV